MNLAIRDVKYRLGRFILTAIGVGLLLGTVMAMGGIYRGLVEDALSIVRAPGADLWVVQKDTNGPFAENPRIPDDLYRVVRAVPGVREASPIAFQSVQLEYGATSVRTQIIGYRPGNLGGPPVGREPFRDGTGSQGRDSDRHAHCHGADDLYRGRSD